MRRVPIVVLLVAVLAACGSSQAATPPDVPEHLEGIGRLPQPLSIDAVDGDDTTTTSTDSTVPRPTIARSDDEADVGSRVAGNRVIVIGDSITASTSRRYSGEMCFSLLPLGWAVEVNAEVSRFVDFGTVVLDRRLRPDAGIDWDAAVVFLGSNYGGDAERYRAELHSILDRLEPRPTVLVTVTEFRPNRVEVNDVIRGMLAFYPEVQILDWAEITAADRSLLSGDGLHLSDAGRARLSIEVAEALGPAPDVPASDATGPDGVDPGASGSDGAGPDGADPGAGGEPVRPEGECLSTSFTDDSAGRSPSPGAVAPPAGTPGAGNGAGGGGSAGPTTTASSAPNPAPAPPAATAPSTGGTGTVTTVAPPPSVSTVAPTTAGPITMPIATTPSTQPPVTTPAPVVTAPPETPPPDTPPPGGGGGDESGGGGGGEAGDNGDG